MSELLKQATLATEQANWTRVNQYLQQLSFPLESEAQTAHCLDLAFQVLRYGDFQQRWEVTKFLTKLGQPAISPLLAMVQDEDIDLEARWFAGRTLGRFDHPVVIMTLIDLLQTSDDPELTTVAAEALANIGISAIQALTNLLEDSQARFLAVQALAQIRRPQTITPLLRVVNDPSLEIRCLAINALGSFQDERVMTVLQHALQDKNAQVRKEAVTALGIRSKSYQQPEIVALLKPLLYDFNPQVCQQAAIALGQIGTDEAVDALFRVLKSRATPTWLQREAVKALAWSETTLALNYLREGLRWAEEEVCLEIVTLLGRTLSPNLQPQATEILVNFLDSKQLALNNLDIQRAIAQSLGELGQPRAVEALLQLAVSPDSRVSLHAIAGLKKLPNLQNHLPQTSLSPVLQAKLSEILPEISLSRES
jgi:HEAT repeat protein